MSDSTWAERRERYWGQPVPPHLKHGPTTWAYKAYGCGCKVCLPSGKRRAPNGEGKTRAERTRNLRQRKRGKPVPEGTKHGIYTYRVYGCRCTTCRVETNSRENARREKLRWAPIVTGIWEDQPNGTTVLHWPPRGFGWWECPECHEKFEMRRPVDGHAAAA